MVTGPEFEILLRPGQFVLAADVDEPHHADERKWPTSEKVVERSRVPARVHVSRDEGYAAEPTRHVAG